MVYLKYVHYLLALSITNTQFWRKYENKVSSRNLIIEKEWLKQFTVHMCYYMEFTINELVKVITKNNTSCECYRPKVFIQYIISNQMLHKNLCINTNIMDRFADDFNHIQQVQVTKSNWDNIKFCLFRRVMENLKLLVVGDERVGKSSPLETYDKGSFPSGYVSSAFHWDVDVQCTSPGDRRQSN